jgi:ATP-dependent Lon protease
MAQAEKAVPEDLGLDLNDIANWVPATGTSPIARGAGMPGEVAVGVKRAGDPDGLVVLMHKDLELTNAGAKWNGYGVLAIPSSQAQPAIRASTKSRKVKVRSKVAGRQKGWDIIARVKVEIDPDNPGVARWTRSPERSKRVPKIRLHDSLAAFQMFMKMGSEVGPYLKDAPPDVIASRVIGMALRDNPREYEMALAEDRITERLKLAMGSMGRDIAKQTWLDAADRVAYVPLSESSRTEVNRLIDVIDEADDRDASEREIRVLAHIAGLPWGEPPRLPEVNPERARAILDGSHYGLEETKTRVMRILADQLWWGHKVRESGNVNLPPPPLPVICLIGPNGTGKTTLVESIAKILGREFQRLPVGAINNVEKLKGFQSTFVGSKAGGVVGALSAAGTTNLVLLLDEIDKIAAGANGDVVHAALMELLDPSQRAAWVDDMIEGVPVDLSNVLLICTANDISRIPPGLQSRLSFVEVPGHSRRGKVELAKSHLLPRIRADHHLTEAEFAVTDEGLDAVIRDYTQESGVRELIATLETLAQATQDRLVAGKPPHPIDPVVATEMLGVLDEINEPAPASGPPGYYRSLAVSGDGNGNILSGQVIFRKAAKSGGKKIFTGHLGKTYRQSAVLVEAVLDTVDPAVWKKYFGRDLPKDFLQTHDLHVANDRWSGVDGPSAGAMTLMAAISAIFGVPLRDDVLMTGTLTSRGAVQGVGGVDRKLLAAHDAGVKIAVIPTENVGYLRKLPPEVIDPAQGGLKVVTVRHINELLEVFFDAEHVAPFLKSSPEGGGLAVA